MLYQHIGKLPSERELRSLIMVFTVAENTLIPDFEGLYYFNNAVRRTSVCYV